MVIPVKKLNFTPRSPFKRAGGKEREPLIWDRPNRRISAGRPVLILIEGGGQCGKTTLAQYICHHYDEDYVTVYSVQTLLDIMRARVRAFKNGERWMLHKWILFDEIQSEALRSQWRNQRNIVIGQIVGLWGELKTNLVMTLPDIDDISTRLFRNIAMRIIVDANYKNEHIERTAFLFKPIKDVQKKGYKWGSAGRYNIPDYKRPEDYLNSKMDNMETKFERFEADLKRQEDRELNRAGSDITKNYIPPAITKERLAEIEAKINEKTVFLPKK